MQMEGKTLRGVGWGAESEGCWWDGMMGGCKCWNKMVERKTHSAPDGVKDVGGKGPLPALLVVLKNLFPHPLHPFVVNETRGAKSGGNHE